MNTTDVKKSLAIIVTMIMFCVCFVTPATAANARDDINTPPAAVTASSEDSPMLITYAAPMADTAKESSAVTMQADQSDEPMKAPTSYIEVISPAGNVTDLAGNRNLIPIIVIAVLCSAFAIITIIILLSKNSEDTQKHTRKII